MADPEGKKADKHVKRENPTAQDLLEDALKQREALLQEAQDREKAKDVDFRSTLDVEARKDLDWIERNYSVKIVLLDEVFKSHHGHIIQPYCEFSALSDRIKILKKNFCKIPPQVFCKSGINRIVLCDTIQQDSSNNLWGVNDLSGTVYLKMVYSFFHEFFHSMDDVNGENSTTNVEDEHFESADKANRIWNDLEPGKQPSCGNTSPDEDQAFYAQLLLAADSPDQMKVALLEIGNENPKKIEMMKKKLFDWSDGAYDETFWEDLKAGRVDENYWNTRKDSDAALRLLRSEGMSGSP